MESASYARCTANAPSPFSIFSSGSKAGSVGIHLPHASIIKIQHWYSYGGYDFIFFQHWYANPGMWCMLLRVHHLTLAQRHGLRYKALVSRLRWPTCVLYYSSHACSSLPPFFSFPPLLSFSSLDGEARRQREIDREEGIQWSQFLHIGYTRMCVEGVVEWS